MQRLRAKSERKVEKRRARHQREKVKEREGRKETIEQDEIIFQLYAYDLPRWPGWKQPFRIPYVNQPSPCLLPSPIQLFVPACEFIRHILSFDIGNCNISEASFVSRHLYYVTEFWNQISHCPCTFSAAWYHHSCLCDGGLEN